LNLPHQFILMKIGFRLYLIIINTLYEPEKLQPIACF